MAVPKEAKGAPAKKGAVKGIWKLYEKKGDKIERKNKSCPKCGSGTFMAKHASRFYCGNCHYTLFETQSK